MTKTHKDFKKAMMPVLLKLQEILLLQDHLPLDFLYKDDTTAYAECKDPYPYKYITIWYSKKMFDDWVKGERVDDYLVHEMCHTFVFPLWSKAVDRHATPNEIKEEVERLTDHIANIVLKNNLILSPWVKKK